jgi:short-subunit dehydrogenase
MARRTIAGQRALVTGASSGIGQEIARELARQGADVLIVARREERLTALVDEFRQMGRRAEYVAGDITDPVVRQACIERATQALGGLDLLVNNAGIGAIGPFVDASAGRLRQIFEVNFFALVELTRLAMPLLKQGRQPMVVNISSILGHRGVPLTSEYCASKFAVQGFSESLRAELVPHGIDVLVVSPGTTESEFFSHLVEEHARPSWRARKPATSAQVARAAVRGMRRGAHEVFPGMLARLVYWGSRLSPRMMDWIVARV